MTTIPNTQPTLAGKGSLKKREVGNFSVGKSEMKLKKIKLESTEFELDKLKLDSF